MTLSVQFRKKPIRFKMVAEKRCLQKIKIKFFWKIVQDIIYRKYIVQAAVENQAENDFLEWNN